METDLKPTQEEVRRWLLGVLKHTLQEEYFLQELGVGKDDPQRPHDIVGYGNKLEWEVLKGFALQYRDKSPEHFNKYIMPSLEIHRTQYHHQKFNEPNPDATLQDMKLGAVDAICSLLEADRRYQGGKHSYEEIEKITDKSPIHKRSWIKLLIPEMKKIKQPNLEEITRLDIFPNLGVSEETYEITHGRMQYTLRMLNKEYGYNLKQ